MIVFRFCNRRYHDDLSGHGAKLYGGRWNDKGFAALYTSTSISLALLEMLVNAQDLSTLQNLVLMKIQVPDDLVSSCYEVSKLKADWEFDFDYSKWIGSEFLRKNEHLYLRCPSAVINEEHNIMLNPAFPSYKKLKLLTSGDFKFDPRLFKLA